MQAGGFEDVHRAFNVDALVERWFGKTGANARARREMDYLIELHARNQILQRHPIHQVAMDELKRLRQRLNVPQIAAFDLRIVKAVKVIVGPNGMARAEQTLAHVGTNKTRTAGDQKIHGGKLNSRAADVEFAASAANLTVRVA